MVLKPHVFRRLCRARDLLIEEPELDVGRSVHDVARAARMSSFHFIRQFEALFGATPHQFRIRHRLDRAKLLLARGDRSVTDVCMEVGFSSLGSFSDLFARRIGESPSAYQRRVRTVAQVPGGLERALGPGCFDLMAHLPRSAFAIFEKRADGVWTKLPE